MAEPTARPVLTAQRLRECLHYDPTCGTFRWRIKMSSRAMPGAAAGTLTRYGYLQIKVDGVIYRANRLAWLYVTGEWPKGDVDHRSRVRHDNRWENLRDVPAQVNRENTGPGSRRNATGYMGVVLHRQSGLFQAQIGVKGKRVKLGYFQDPEHAHRAYVEAKRKMHEGCEL